MERPKEDEDPAGHSAGQQEKRKENRNHSRLLPILMHEEKKRVIAETNAVRQKQDLCYYKYNHPPPQYKNVRNSKINRMIRREVEGVQSQSSHQVVGLKEKLKLKKSLQRNFSRISFFNGKKEARFNIKVSLQRKLTSMMSYIKLF